MNLEQKICHFHSHFHFHFQLLRNNWIFFWLSDSALAVLLSQIFENFTFFYSLSHLKLSHWEDISKHCYVIIGSGSGSESGSGSGSGRFFDLKFSIIHDVIVQFFNQECCVKSKYENELFISNYISLRHRLVFVYKKTTKHWFTKYKCLVFTFYFLLRNAISKYDPNQQF